MDENRKIRVLWFSNSSANADEYFNSVLKGTGGWLKALNIALQDKVDLHIAFYYTYNENFKFQNTFYYPLKMNSSFKAKIKRVVFNKVKDHHDIKNYLDIVNHVKPDIIHIHGTEEPFLGIQGRTKVPIVVSIQGNLTVYLYKYFNGFERKYLRFKSYKPYSIKRFFFPQSFKSNYIQFVKRQKIEERNLKDAKYIMGRTAWDYRITRILSKGSKYFSEDRILRESFYNIVWKPNQNDRTIIHTTNSNIFYKGFETLCQALYELNMVGFECEWRVAGISDDDLIVKITKSKLKHKYPKHGLRLLGKLNENELVTALSNADIFVMPSHIENNVNSLCEAMIIGMPCISTFVGGVGSLIQDGDEGLLIQSGDPWAMAGAIIELASDKEKAFRLGQNARKKALLRHDKKRIADELVYNYHRIIAESKEKL